MMRQPVRAPRKKFQQLAVVHPEQRVGLNPREQRKRRRARGFLEGKIIVARAVLVRAARHVAQAGFDPLPERRLQMIRVVRERQLVRERERPHEFRRHPARKIDDLVVPVVAIEAAVRRRVRVAILQREDFRDQRERFPGEEVAHRGGGGRKRRSA
jgi:hypothetical protein